jgi:hypothetical protein
MTITERIAKEYDEPFADVVIGFIEMGYSQRTVALVLNVNRSHFRSLCKQHQILFPARPRRRDCQGQGKGWPKGKPRFRAPKYSDTQLLNELRKYPISTLFQTMSDIDISTIYRRFGSFRSARQLARR